MYASSMTRSRLLIPLHRRGGGGGDRGPDRGGRDWDNNYGQNRRGGRGRGRGRGWGGGGGGGGGRDDWDHRGSGWGDARGRPYEDEFGRGPRRGGFENRHNNNNRRGGYGGPGGPGGGPPTFTSGPPPPPPTFSQPPAVPPVRMSVTVFTIFRLSVFSLPDQMTVLNKQRRCSRSVLQFSYSDIVS